MKTFVAEARSRFEEALDGLNFDGPEVVDEKRTPPLVMTDGDLSSQDKVGINTAHTGHQMRRALGRHAQAASEELHRYRRTRQARGHTQGE
ncbi:hypothetical protein ETD83_08830 [Actinomadura soli]|uniref:Uncharacterized protein n=1 Tax=Actinomadura soli TaxID=2508997 RepID=A0A5C4JFZ8_9ACTN|nr:hypothetical protein [Actinomadura soli]TMR04269.1 hypothetical protein ETD83_08830 [Actinomadura soli]